MLNALKGLDAHKAYNQFRSFAEIFDMLDLDPGLNTVVVAGDGGGDGGGDGSDESVVGMNANVVQLYRQLRADFKAEQAAHAATQQEVVQERAENVAAHGNERAAHAAALAEERAAHAKALAEERSALAAARAEIAQLRALLSKSNV